MIFQKEKGLKKRTLKQTLILDGARCSVLFDAGDLYLN
jgi:hypothetical protein